MQATEYNGTLKLWGISMTKIALILVVVCAIAGSMFYMWTSRTQEPAPGMSDCIIQPPPGVPQKPAIKANADVDFGPYMAELQRRIKRAWFPPKSHESDRVQVVFKVHSNGTMSSLRLLEESDFAESNQAAMKAIQNAAPFRPLPDGAPQVVDIQFTFDYNVFKGGPKDSFRRY